MGELPSVTRPSGEVVRKFKYSADVTIHRGLFHVVKRLFDAVGKSVHALHRLGVGGLLLQDLGLREPGEFCELTGAQRSLLWGDCAICCRAPKPRASTDSEQTDVGEALTQLKRKHPDATAEERSSSPEGTDI